MRFTMNKLILPAFGAALVLGAPPVVAEDILISQLMIMGQPGQTGNANRTLPSGSAGVAPLNMPAPAFSAVPSVPSAIQPTPFIGQRGELNAAEPEFVGPSERDETGRLRPSVDRTQARFTGERGADGKLLPTYVPQHAQARPAQPAAPGPTELKRDQPPAAQPGMRQPSGQAQTGTTGTGQPMQKGQTQRSGSTMSGRGDSEEYTTSALNKLSAEGYTNFGRLERVGNTYQTTAMRQGRQVSVQVDLETGRVMER
jgi:hypothetical protein